jgi:gluconate 2-dehydrogenase gamma chain
MMSSESAVSRRELLKRMGLAGVAVFALPEPSRVLMFRQQMLAQLPALTASESATLSAMCARIIPTDENGPGAVEARAATYIERALGGWLASSRADYAQGLAAVDEAARAKAGRPFAELPPADQDAVLTSIEDTPFFALVRTHTIQGTFCDPAYGGNAKFVGWDLIGYPGIRLNVTAADQRMAEYAKPIRRSAYEYAMFANSMGAASGH